MSKKAKGQTIRTLMQDELSAVPKPELLEQAIALKMKRHFMNQFEYKNGIRSQS